MKIESVKVHNFRSFVEREFKLSSAFNVLIGRNGTGKTAILDALAIGAGSIFLALEGASSPSIDSEDVRIVSHRREQIVSREPQYPSGVECQGDVGPGPVRWSRTLERKKGRTTRSDTGELVEHLRALQVGVQRGTEVELPLLAYYRTGRLWLQKKARRVDPAKPGSRYLGYRDCLAPASDKKGFVAWFKSMELIQLQRRVEVGVLSAVKAALKSCLGGWKDVWFDVSEDELMAQSKDDHVLPFRMLSDGVRNMLAMVGDIAYRAATLNPQFGAEAATRTDGIVLIDEIDLHLHPSWQRRVVDDLRRTFPKLQFVATTHSPFIIQALRPGELINLDDESREALPSQSIEDITETVMGVPVPQRSQRHEEMMKAAEEYYRVLEEAKGADKERLPALKARLDELSEPFSDDIAYHAFLKLKRQVAGIDEKR